MYQLLVDLEGKIDINKNGSTLCFYGLWYVNAFVANTLIEHLFAAVLWPSSPAEG